MAGGSGATVLTGNREAESGTEVVVRVLDRLSVVLAVAPGMAARARASRSAQRAPELASLAAAATAALCAGSVRGCGA